MNFSVGPSTGPLHLNLVKICRQPSLADSVHEQTTKDSSNFPHMPHTFSIPDMNLDNLSLVRRRPKEILHIKTLTFRGVSGLQIWWNIWSLVPPSAIKEYTDRTENTPEGHHLQSHWSLEVESKLTPCQVRTSLDILMIYLKKAHCCQLLVTHLTSLHVIKHMIDASLELLSTYVRYRRLHPARFLLQT